MLLVYAFVLTIYNFAFVLNVYNFKLQLRFDQ